MNSGVKLGVGITGGYLLGRTKKLKLAIGLGTWLMGRRLQMSPAQLALQGLTQLRETPEFAELSDRLRDEIGGAGKRALAAAATSRMESLTDKLHDRNSGLINGEPDDLYDDDRDEDDDYDEDDEPRAQADEDDYDDEDDDYDGESDEYDEYDDEADEDEEEEDDEGTGRDDLAEDEAYPDEEPRKRRASSGRRQTSSARR